MIPQGVEVVGDAQKRAEATVDREVGGLQHHGDGGHRPHDGLHRLKRGSRPFLGLTHERWRGLLAAVPCAAVAGAVSCTTVTAILTVPPSVRLVAVGGVSGHGIR